MDNLNSLFRIAGLIAKEREGEISSDEKQEIEKWLKENANNRLLYTQLKEGEDIYRSLGTLNSIDTKKPFSNTWRKIRQVENGNKRIITLPKFVKYAATVLLFIAGSATVYFAIQKLNHENRQLISEIVPGTQKAILTLGSGEKIALNNTIEEIVFSEQQVNIVDANNTLTYLEKEPEKIEKTVIYNTLETPKGGEYSVVLSDGTRIWLNAASKLKYPTEFSEEVRYVELEGEAYFEVSKNPIKPFIVKTQDMEITVLGTSFNIMAYDDEDNIETTLVEGRVGIEFTSENALGEVILNSGEQAAYNRNTNKINLQEVDVQLYTAWTHGIFVFDNEPLEDILKKLSRWYNVEIVFTNEDLKYRSFTGDLKRYENISTILDMISIASDLEFKIEGKTIFITKFK